MTNKYIKKVIPVEAVLWDGTNFEEIKEFILSKKPDEIICEPFKEKMRCTDRFSSFYYNKGAVLFYDKKNKKDVFKYGDDCLNNYSCFGVLPLGYYLYFDCNNGAFDSLKKEEFEAEYERQNDNHTSKSSSFSLRDLVMQIAPKHIKYYIKRLEKYGIKLKYVNEAEIKEESAYIPFTALVDKNGHEVVVVDRHDCIDTQTGFELWTRNKDEHKFDVKSFEAEDNNWREAFNKLVASFPDEILKNTNHHASLTL